MGDGPAAVDGPDHVVVGDEHIAEEHLVELRVAGGHLQRADLHAVGVHVDGHHRDAVVLGHVGVRADRGEAHAGVVGAGRPHLLPGSPTNRRQQGGLRLHAGGVGAGVGLAEQLAPDHLLVEGRAHPVIHL